MSRYGIREGLLLEAARVVPTIADPGEARARSVGDFAQRCHAEQPHSSHVQMLALALFDALGERLGCNRDDRAALSDAALLHDAGYHISYERHHKHSYHLVLHADLLGMPPSEQVVVANVARYHRGSEPRRTPPQLRHARQDAAPPDPPLVGDPSRRGRPRPRPRERGRRGQGALDAARDSHHAGAGSPRPRGAMRLEMWGAHRRL